MMTKHDIRKHSYKVNNMNPTNSQTNKFKVGSDISYLFESKTSKNNDLNTNTVVYKNINTIFKVNYFIFYLFIYLLIYFFFNINKLESKYRI